MGVSGVCNELNEHEIHEDDLLPAYGYGHGNVMHKSTALGSGKLLHLLLLWIFEA
jgi:hypothetical protein